MKQLEGTTQKEYELDLYDNTREKMFGIRRDEFYELFLECHNSSETRVEFADIFESEYLKSRSYLNAEKLSVKNEDGWGNISVTPWRDWLRRNYWKYLNKCKRYFDVIDSEMKSLPDGDWDAPERALRRQYFETNPVVDFVQDETTNPVVDFVQDETMQHEHDPADCDGVMDMLSSIFPEILDCDVSI